MANNIVKMRTRSQYEDIVHDLICRILPKFPPEDIHPAYQFKRSYAGKNVVSLTPGDDGVTGYTNEDNFMFFAVKFDVLSFLPYIDEEGAADTTRVIEVTCNVYGESSANVALLIQSLILDHDAQSYLHSFGLHTFDEYSWNITQVNEQINGEYWERHDVSFKLCECTDLVVPYFAELAETAEITTVVDGEVKNVKSI